MPWSVKAGDLLRHQYAAVGAAARAALPEAVRLLAEAAARGVDVAALAARTTARAANAEAFTAAYRRYCWPVDGLDGVRLAPFQILATEGAVYHERDHSWHLGLADRLAAAAPGLITVTRRLRVDTADPDSVAAGIAWWEELTGAGGEGMVVKPHANLTRAARPGLVGAWPSPASRSGAGSTCGSSTAPTTPSPPTWPGSGTATSAASARWRCGSTPWARGPGPGRAGRAVVADPRGGVRSAGAGIRAGGPPSVDGRGAGGRRFSLRRNSGLACLIRRSGALAGHVREVLRRSRRRSPRPASGRRRPWPGSAGTAPPRRPRPGAGRTGP